MYDMINVCTDFSILAPLVELRAPAREYAECRNSFIYSSGHCCRSCPHMQVKIVAGSLFDHCKIARFNLVTTEQWLVVLLRNFVPLRKTLLTISCKIFSWIRMMKLKIHGILGFYKGFCKPKCFVPRTLTVTSTWRPMLTAHFPTAQCH